MAGGTRGGRRVAATDRARRAGSGGPFARAATDGRRDDTARPARAVPAATGAVPASARAFEASSHAGRRAAELVAKKVRAAWRAARGGNVVNSSRSPTAAIVNMVRRHFSQWPQL